MADKMEESVQIESCTAKNKNNNNNNNNNNNSRLVDLAARGENWLLPPPPPLAIRLGALGSKVERDEKEKDEKLCCASLQISKKREPRGTRLPTRKGRKTRAKQNEYST
jgi:hypothetical protein